MGFEQPTMVEPVDPLQCGVFDRFEAAPPATPVDHLGLVEAVDRFGQSVAIAVADAANRGFDPGLGHAKGGNSALAIQRDDLTFIGGGLLPGGASRGGILCWCLRRADRSGSEQRDC